MDCLNKLTVKWLMEFVTWVFIWGFGLGMNVRVKLFIVVIGEGNLLLALWLACYSTEVGEISAYWCGWIKDQLRKIETERAFNVKMNIFYNSLNPMGKIITFNGNLNTRSPLIQNVWKWWIDTPWPPFINQDIERYLNLNPTLQDTWKCSQEIT